MPNTPGRRAFIQATGAAATAAMVTTANLSAQPKPSVLILVEAKAAAGKREELKALLLGNMHEIVEADGCQSVRFHISGDDPDVLLFVEYWDTRASYDKYLAWRYAKGDHARMVALMDGEVSVRAFEAVA